MGSISTVRENDFTCETTITQFTNANIFNPLLLDSHIIDIIKQPTDNQPFPVKQSSDINGTISLQRQNSYIKPTSGY